MISVLSKCTLDDFEYLSGVLNSTFSFADDKGRKELLEKYRTNPIDENKKLLLEKFDVQIRYFGSADGAYLYRKITGSGGEVSANEVVNDVADKLKVPQVPFGSTDTKLQHLIKAVVEKEFRSKSPDELSEALKKLMVKPEVIEEVLKETAKIGPIAVLPIIMQVAGKKAVIPIIEAIITGLVSRLIGVQAASLLAKEIGKRNPIINALGPVAWAISGVWLAFDLQGPAYSKTVPVCLYLGLVSLRDGGEDDLWRLTQVSN